jgi:hypothetical protein
MKKRTIVLVPLFALAAIALSACGGGKSSNANSSNTTNTAAPAGATYAGNQKVPNCGAVQAVWVNLNTKVYHEPGDPVYGHTKRGEYLCPSQAVAQGFHRAGGGMSNGGDASGGKRRHHRRASAAPEETATPY